MDSFPAYFPLKGRRVVIAGEGDAADARARLFAGSPAQVIRLRGDVALNEASYRGAQLVFVASHDQSFARKAAAAARACGAPVNVFDRPALSDFHTPAIVDRGVMVAAIGTSGSAPLMAQLFRAVVEAHVPEGAGRIATLLGERRKSLIRAFPDLVRRRAFLRAVLAGPVATEAEAGETGRASERLDELIAAGWVAAGRLWLIVRPAADDLVSLRAARAISFADIVIAPPEADPLLARHARRDAERRPGATAAELGELVRSGHLVAVVDPPAELAAALALEGPAFDVLRPAPEDP